ncbi:MAG: alpha/beta hydrolase family protein [Sphingomonas sp.]
MKTLVLGGMLLLGGLQQVQGDTPSSSADGPAHAFGARPEIEDVSLSPDGSSLAAIEPNGARGSALYVVKLDGDRTPKPILTAEGGKEELRDCHWSTDTRIVCTIYLLSNQMSDILGFERVISIGSDGTDEKVLTAPTNARSLGVAQLGGEVIDWLSDDNGGSVLMEQTHVPESTTGTSIANTRQGLGVTKIDTTSLRQTTVEQPERSVQNYITDGHGVVRVKAVVPQGSSGYDSDVTDYFYRKRGETKWRPLSRVVDHAGKGEGFAPAAVDRDLDVAYGFDDYQGHLALYSVALDGSLKKTLIYARPDVDVADLVTVGRQQRVVGVSYVTDERHTDFFDPELKALRTSLAKALPNDPLVTFVDASADESKLLLFAGGDVDPGTYYLFDKKTRHLNPLLAQRPNLASTRLSPVKAVTFQAADGTMVPAYLTLPPGLSGKHLPAIVMPHGGPSDRDEWGFDWLVQFFAQRGYAVLQPNYRGSAGYGDAWFQDNGFRSWRTAIGDIDDGGRWLIKQGIADPSKLAIVGWSYGGYAALQSAVVDPDLFKAIVAIAPVTDLQTLKNEALHFTNYHNVAAFVGDGPDLVAGSPAKNADRFKAPVLLFHGTLDQNVGVGESQLMADRLKSAGKKVQLVTFDGLTHQLDDSDARTRMLETSDAFLRQSMGM